MKELTQRKFLKLSPGEQTQAFFDDCAADFTFTNRKGQKVTRRGLPMSDQVRFHNNPVACIDGFCQTLPWK